MSEDCVLPDYDEESGNRAVAIYAILDRDCGDTIDMFREAPESVIRVLYALLTHDPDRQGHEEQKETNAFWVKYLELVASQRGIVFRSCKCVADKT